MIEELLAALAAWAADRPDVRALALVGSHARGTARADSDVDLVVLADDPRALLRDAAWTDAFGAVARRALEDYGRVQSLRTWYANGLEVEFGIAAPDWALAPDEGTRRVVRDGLRVLWDRDGVFARL